MKHLVSATAFLLLATTVGGAQPRVLFEDHFAGKLGEGWTWLRENPGSWRLADRALEIRVEPGRALDVKNALLRPAPDRAKVKYVAEVTVTFNTPPTKQYEQGGITLYQKGKPIFKLVHELIDGKTYIIPGKVLAEAPIVRLRLVLSAEGYQAQFQPDAKGEFVTAASGKLPAPASDEQISIQCYNGPGDAEHWINFRDFRLLESE